MAGKCYTIDQAKDFHMNLRVITKCITSVVSSLVLRFYVTAIGFPAVFKKAIQQAHKFSNFIIDCRRAAISKSIPKVNENMYSVNNNRNCYWNKLTAYAFQMFNQQS